MNASESLDCVFRIASQELPAVGVNALLIGGFAVNHYGYTRNTLDVDFMIVSDQLETARQLMRAAGFTNIDIRETVAYFSDPDSGIRVDFLCVDAATMTQLLAHAQPAEVRGFTLRLPSLRDLLAMKIFAFSRNPERRMGKDLPDIAYLSTIHELDVEREIVPLCQRYGTPEALRMIQIQIEALRTP